MAININGDGLIELGGTSTTQGRVRLAEDTDNGTNYIELTAPASVAANRTITFPDSDGTVINTAPGTSGNVLTSNGTTWLSQALPAGFSGATINAPSASNLTLTNTSTQYQRVQFTSEANSTVTLPDATTLSTEGSYPFVIENRSLSNQTIDIKNNAGAVLQRSGIGGVVACSLVDNSTAAGVWSTELVGAASPSYIVENTASITSTTLTTATYIQRPRIMALTATKFIMYYVTFATTTATVRIRVGDISGSTITYGAEQTGTFTTASDIASAETVTNIYCTRLSDTAFVIFQGAGGRASGCCAPITAVSSVRTCTVSGTTVTFGTASTLSFPAYSASTGTIAIISNGTVVRMSDTKFAVFYNTAITGGYPTGFSGSLTCNIITVSGTTQTIGTKVDLGTSTYTQVLGAVCYDTDKLLICYGQASSGSRTGRTKLVVVTVSGTTPTWNTPVNVQSADVTCQTDSTDSGKGFIYALSTSKCFVPYVEGAGTSGYKAAIISISGTTPSVDKSASYSNVYQKVARVFATLSATSFANSTRENFTYVTTDGFYTRGYATVGTTDIYDNSFDSLPPSGSTSIVGCSLGTGNSTALTTSLATAYFN